MDYFVNYPVGRAPEPGAWARQMESVGFAGVCASDHLWTGNHAYPHAFVLATQLACATERIRITTSFCNNLFRSPVEFAQASLTLHQASGGRFDAGLGAGWLEDEMRAIGLDYPAPGERISRYIEAVDICRQLFEDGTCTHQGEHYRVEIGGDRAIAHPGSAPPLLAAAGGPRALRELSSRVDRIEIKASARSTRGGSLDFAEMASVTEEEVRAQVQRVRSVSATVPMGIFILIAVGDDPAVQQMKAGLGNGWLARFIGEAEEVAAALQSLSEFGIDRVQLTELVPGSQDRLAPALQLGD